VVDHALEARLVEHLEKVGAAALTGVIERVVIRLRASLDQQPQQREVAAVDRVVRRGQLPLAVGRRRRAAR